MNHLISTIIFLTAIEHVTDNVTCASYFQTLGLRLVRGRWFDHRDTAQTLRVVIINEAMARKFWSDEDPLGRYLTFNSSTQYEIVGVVSNVKHSSLREEGEPEAYTSHQQVPSRTMDLAVRADFPFDREPAALINGIRQAVGKVDPEQATHNIATMEQRLSNSIAPQRFVTSLLSLFATLAMIQALIGIYGMMSYLVTQRAHEIGVRMALGAQRNDVLKLVIGQGMRVALIGVGVGLISALALTRLLKTLLFDVSPTDPLTFAVIPALLASAQLLACWIPARRATKVDPLVALRAE